MDSWPGTRRAGIASSFPACRKAPASFNDDLPVGVHYISSNPYHVSTGSNFAYETRWREMFGRAAELETGAS